MPGGRLGKIPIRSAQEAFSCKPGDKARRGSALRKGGSLVDGAMVAMVTWIVCTCIANYPTYKGGARERLAVKGRSQPGIGE